MYRVEYNENDDLQSGERTNFDNTPRVVSVCPGNYTVAFDFIAENHAEMLRNYILIYPMTF